MDDKDERRRTDRLRHAYLPEYVDHLERAIRTHASYATISGEQAFEIDKRLTKIRESRSPIDMVAYADDGQSMRREILLLELQSSIHTLGMTVAVSALTQLAAMGVDVPQPPPVMPIEEDDG